MIQEVSNSLAYQGIPLSKDITTLDNEWLTREAPEEAIQQVVNQINPLKVPEPESMHVILPKILPHNW